MSCNYEQNLLHEIFQVTSHFQSCMVVVLINTGLVFVCVFCLYFDMIALSVASLVGSGV